VPLSTKSPCLISDTMYVMHLLFAADGFIVAEVECIRSQPRSSLLLKRTNWLLEDAGSADIGPSINTSLLEQCPQLNNGQINGLTFDEGSPSRFCGYLGLSCRQNLLECPLSVLPA
jgi:hypothetical protein